MSLQRAQELFEDWIEALQKIPDLKAESLIEGEPEEVQRLYQEIVDDFRALQQGRPSSHAVPGAISRERLHHVLFQRRPRAGVVGRRWNADS